MGGNVSKDKSKSELVNEFVTEVVTNVTNTKKTSVSSEQKIKIECNADVYSKVVAACNEATKAQSADKTEVLKIYAENGMDPPVALIESYNKKPAVCEACSAENISQSSTMTISMNDVQDNSIAGKIQSELSSKLDAAKQTLQNEGFSKNSVIDEAVSTVQNKIRAAATANIINETLASFVNKQDITVSNASASNVAQVSVINFVSATIVENVVEGDASVKGAIDTLVGKSNIQKSMASNTTDMVGSVANNLIDTVGDTLGDGLKAIGNIGSIWVLIIIAFIIVGGVVAVKVFGGGSHQAEAARNQQMNYGQQMGYGPQGSQMAYV